MKMIKSLISVCVIVTTLYPIAGFSKNVWRDCGIGALIFTETKWAAVTSNVIWDLGLTGSSSTSSSEDQCAGKGASTAHFIYQNYALIEEETAIGSGDHLVTMLNILGCDNNAHNDIIQSIRSGFTKDVFTRDYSSKTKVQKAQNYYNNVIEYTTGKFESNCAVI